MAHMEAIIAWEGRHLGNGTDLWTREAVALLADPVKGIRIEERDGKLVAIATLGAHDLDGFVSRLREYAAAVDSDTLDRLAQDFDTAFKVLRATTQGRSPDGTERLVRALHGRSAKPQDYLGGSQARMLHEGADRIEALRALLNEGISTGDDIGPDQGSRWNDWADRAADMLRLPVPPLADLRGLLRLPVPPLADLRGLLRLPVPPLADLRGLLREALAQLVEHDSEYHHVTPPELLARIRAALGGDNGPA